MERWWYGADRGKVWSVGVMLLTGEWCGALVGWC